MADILANTDGKEFASNLRIVQLRERIARGENVHGVTADILISDSLYLRLRSNGNTKDLNTDEYLSLIYGIACDQEIDLSFLSGFDYVISYWYPLIVNANIPVREIDESKTLREVLGQFNLTDDERVQYFQEITKELTRNRQIYPGIMTSLAADPSGSQFLRHMLSIQAEPFLREELNGANSVIQGVQNLYTLLTDKDTL